ncbi:MAG: translation elongation factor 4 [Candidatus Jorgensenbacteria bacterium]|nr:translation elongation factor 4 [Candidatus Jorgensenbacteria bacterium]
MKHIRNFVIIAHVDHGKSTLADRFLEVTKTVEIRKMKDQYLDQLELERERGITIKMAPVRMRYEYKDNNYILNLIDTPGHSDFSYEVSRSLNAVEGAVLLVDATQGIQAQTLANHRIAKAAGLTIVGALNKVDFFKDVDGNINLDDERIHVLRKSLAELIGVTENEIHNISGKTGDGVQKLLEDVIEKVPPPKESIETFGRALVFDSFFDDHKGVIASVRMFDGEISGEDEILLIATNTYAKIKETGYFTPQLTALPATSKLTAGEIGYIATGIRDPEKIRIGDTVLVSKYAKDPEKLMLHGYKEAMPVVFVSFYPEESDNFELLSKGLQKLKLNDSALHIEPDQNEVLGRGFKVGFLGRLHFEITAERLRREFNVETVNTFPSVLYRVKKGLEWFTIVKPEELPNDYDEIWEPIIKLDIILPNEYLSSVIALQRAFRFSDLNTETIGDRVRLMTHMPLAELVSDFDDQLKSATKGMASFSYEVEEYKKADVVRVDILLSHELIPGLSRFLPKEIVLREARQMVGRLKEHLPRQQWTQPIQAQADGQILAREDIPALRKDVTGYLYGGDRTRKMKLWKKQQRGKKNLEARAQVQIAPEVFKELLKR